MLIDLALKEWAAVIAAVADGSQSVLLRKGGLNDPRFGVEADRFLLYPTWLHQKERQFRNEARRYFEETDSPDVDPPRVDLRVWCDAVAIWRVTELETLMQLSDEIVFTEETILERYRFRPDQAMHIIAVTAYELPVPVTIDVLPRYGGCRSWLAIETPVGTAGSRLVAGADAAATVDRISSLVGSAPSESRLTRQA